MDFFILVVAIIIALIFFMAGLVKLIKSFESQAERMKWTTEKSINFIRFIALSEMIGAILFIFPYYLDFLSFLSTIAALGLAVLMIGAPITHLKLGEHKEAALTTFILILLLLITFIRIFV